MSNLALFPSYYGVLVQIIAFDSGCLYLIPHLGGILNTGWEIRPQKTRGITPGCDTQHISIHWTIQVYTTSLTDTQRDGQNCDSSSMHLTTCAKIMHWIPTLYRFMQSFFDRQGIHSAILSQRSGSLAGYVRIACSSSFCSSAVHGAGLLPMS